MNPIPVRSSCRPVCRASVNQFQASRSSACRTGVVVLRFADLDIAALSYGHVLDLTFWYALRSQDPAGTGHLDGDCVSRTRVMLGWSSRVLRQTVTAGERVFWAQDQHRGLWLKCPARIATALGVQSFRKAFYMPVSRLRGPLGLVKARLAIPAIAAIRCGRPISVETMAGMLKVSPRTVRRWIRKSGITPIKNLAIVAPLRPGSRLKDYLATGGPNLRTIKFRGQRFLCRQIANSFPEFGQEGVRSRLRHANRSVRRLRAGATTFVHTGEGTRRSRLYVESGNRETTIPSHPVVYTLVGTVKKPVHGAPPVRLWSPVIPEVRG